MATGIQVVTSVTSFSNMAKGYMGVTLLDYSTSALSVINAGSVLEVAGTCFRWDANETPGTWTTCTTAATAYLTCVPSGSAGSQILTSGWTNTAPAWQPINQGWYATAGSASRVIVSAYKTSNTSQNNKRLLLDPIANGYNTPGAIHADGAIDSDTTILADGVITAGGGVVAGTGNDTLLKKIVNIGDWNMDATVSVSIDHGLTSAKIVSAAASVRNDAGDTYYSIPVMDGNTLSLGFGTIPSSYIPKAWDATHFFLTRLTGGMFDSSDFDATTYNRGFIIIEYIP
jgi:hypothetical protein